MKSERRSEPGSLRCGKRMLALDLRSSESIGLEAGIRSPIRRAGFPSMGRGFGGRSQAVAVCSWLRPRRSRPVARLETALEGHRVDSQVAPTLSPDHLDALLRRLAPDRETAGRRYVQLSQRLRTVFLYRGCLDPDALVAETLDRSGRKLAELGDRYEGKDPAPYVFGVAWNVARESLRRRAPDPLPEGREIPDPGPPDPTGTAELRSTCLDRCLEELGEDDRRLTLRYYEGEKRERIQSRAALAADLGVTANALRLKVHRLTRRLRQCVFRCIELRGQIEIVPSPVDSHVVKG